MPERVTLAVETAELDGWKQVTMTRSLEAIAGVVEFELSDVSPDDPRRRQVRRGDAFELRLGGAPVLSGYLHQVAPSYTSDSHEVRALGKEASADLVRCSVEKQPPMPSSLEALVAALCKPFEIPVYVETDTGQRFESFVTKPAEKVFEAITRAASFRGVLLLPDGLGGLIITLPGLRTASVRLEKGRNIIGGGAVFDDEERFSRITLKTQQEAAWGGAWPPQQATATDRGIRRHLPLIEISPEPSESLSALQARARRQVNLRAGQGDRVQYTVRGWREGGEDETGPLWAPGDLVSVYDPFLGIDRELLISTVTSSQGPNGTVTKLSLMHPEAFDLREIEPSEDDALVFWPRE